MFFIIQMQRDSFYDECDDHRSLSYGSTEMAPRHRLVINNLLVDNFPRKSQKTELYRQIAMKTLKRLAKLKIYVKIGSVLLSFMVIKSQGEIIGKETEGWN